mmetsp:Transcript_5770/g.8853  ORF Transcript_5770/g.8853 Transcript_5770/m.8853 type:complete len:177 (+) Transcript_5770:143-673(+)
MIFVLILLLLASFIPSILLVCITNKLQTSHQLGNSPLTWGVVLLPLGVPLVAFVFSTMLIAMKWMVVGRYRSTEMATPSITYLQRWFMDRVMHLWEFWIGRFLVETKFAYMFYHLMGADIHPSARLNTFVREFDLVTIGAEASVSYSIRCRKFGPLDQLFDCGPLRLRRAATSRGW